jgi:hypothetical protein
VNCSEVCSMLAEGSTPGPEAQAHMGECKICSALAARIPVSYETADPATVQRYKELVGRGLTRVRPIASERQLTFLFAGLFLCFSVCATMPVGFYGLHALAPAQMALYFAVLFVGGLFAASAVVQEMIPGSRRYLNPRVMFLVEACALIATVLLLFHSFQVSRSFLQGRACLTFGGECAVAISVLFAFVLKDGWFVAPVRAGSVTGFLAGLSGVAVLAMHCSVLTTPHILVWHIGVLPLSTLGGALIGLAIQKYRGLRNF